MKPAKTLEVGYLQVRQIKKADELEQLIKPWILCVDRLNDDGEISFALRNIIFDKLKEFNRLDLLSTFAQHCKERACEALPLYFQPF